MSKDCKNIKPDGNVCLSRCKQNRRGAYLRYSMIVLTEANKVMPITFQLLTYMYDNYYTTFSNHFTLPNKASICADSKWQRKGSTLGDLILDWPVQSHELAFQPLSPNIYLHVYCVLVWTWP